MLTTRRLTKCTYEYLTIFQPSDEYDDDEARFALLAKEKERMDKKGGAKAGSGSSNYEKRGAKPKVKK